ncbi:PREDICTED: leukocyte elastase inhibitor-like [Rhagoletis zephyria]|uniref:leukocyte elastase inhibitor-like n=1 Tax=Rhagoletis zephyria TaxID=28612 RepID=UPI0008112931|nr:PREDICTED: leukocyte elastase inhibitor-like [Rhagoletis zephyria]XP_036343314.1 serine protease inhibitor 27A-like [Rhagoletis pomonella]XP_036343364.1 serine protease inhibitor 27A-like [Rhagoletis pomonella]
MTPKAFEILAIYAFFITYTCAFPTAEVVERKANITQLTALQNSGSDNIHTNVTSNVFDIPPGIFTSYVPLSAEPIMNDEDDYVPYRSDVHDHFSWALLKQILLSTSAARSNNIKTDSVASFFPEDTENVIFSPFSVKLVLALLTEATGNGTRSRRQLLATLGDIKAAENLRSFYRKTLASLKKVNPHYTLHLETRLYTDASIKPLPAYEELLKSAYETPIEQLEFADGVAAAEQINSWIARATEGRLQQLVTEEGVANSVMLLVNAIYFNGLWRRQFSESHSGVFFRTPREQLKVSYMELTDNFYFYQCNELKARIVRLPYRGQKFSMFVALPNNERSIDSLLRRMQNEQLKHMQWMMERTKFRVVMPKFKFGYKTDLKAALCRLGVVDIFTDNAELTAMVANKDSRLLVSNILQKSGIDVNEQGTEAYAATEVEIVNRFGGSDEVEEFIVNRPFIFFIEEESTGNILFAGKVMNPTA